jgi:hypothetical protein
VTPMTHDPVDDEPTRTSLWQQARDVMGFALVIYAAFAVGLIAIALLMLFTGVGLP